MKDTVVGQELLLEVAVRSNDRSAAGHVGVNDEVAELHKWAEQERQHLAWVAISAGSYAMKFAEKSLGAACLGACSHGLHDLGDALVHLARDLITLGLV
eukprot:12654441-Heterocapsa_arctica.AAC.1